MRFLAIGLLAIAACDRMPDSTPAKVANPAVAAVTFDGGGL